MKKITIFAILISLLLALLIYLASVFPSTLNSDQNIIALITTIIVLTSLFARIASSSNTNLFKFIIQIFAWFFIGIVILAGYSYQTEIKAFGNRLIANLVPGYGESKSNQVTFYAGNGGHFTINAMINDTAKITFLFDTGASMIALTPEDAKRIGIDLKSLNYNFPLSTANGVSWGARITLTKVQIGDIIENNVEATVANGGLDTSLLGMSFLKRLKQFEIHDNVLTLLK